MHSSFTAAMQNPTTTHVGWEVETHRFSKHLTKSDIDQGLYIPTLESDVIHRSARGDRTQPILICVAEAGQDLFVRTTKWGNYGGALKMTGRTWHDVVSATALEGAGHAPPPPPSCPLAPLRRSPHRLLVENRRPCSQPSRGPATLFRALMSAVGEQLQVEVLGSFPAPKVALAENPGVAPRVVMLSFSAFKPIHHGMDDAAAKGRGKGSSASDGFPATDSTRDRPLGAAGGLHSGLEAPGYSPPRKQRRSAGVPVRHVSSTEHQMLEARIARLEARLAMVEWHVRALQEMLQMGAGTSAQGAHMVSVVHMGGGSAQGAHVMPMVHLGQGVQGVLPTSYESYVDYPRPPPGGAHQGNPPG